MKHNPILTECLRQICFSVTVCVGPYHLSRKFASNFCELPRFTKSNRGEFVLSEFALKIAPEK